jgi:hypothetical protein
LSLATEASFFQERQERGVSEVPGMRAVKYTEEREERSSPGSEDIAANHQAPILSQYVMDFPQY